MLNIDSSASLAKVIDHSILKPNTTEADVNREIDVALKWNVASICVMPCYLPLVVSRLQGTSIIPCTVSGFPLGYGRHIDKLFCVRNSIHTGAQEIDYVLNISDIVSEKWKLVEHEIATVVDDCQRRKVKSKIIFENCYLNLAHKLLLTELCSKYKADWIKTSTGFGPSGAILEDVQLMVKNAVAPTQVKAAGGIKTFEAMMMFVNAGVTRCGCSATDEVLTKAKDHYGR